MGVGLLEFHQFDRMLQAGREAARALLADGFLDERMTASELPSLPEPDPVDPRDPASEGLVSPA